MTAAIFTVFMGCEQENPPATSLEPPPPESFTASPQPAQTMHTGTGTVTAIDKEKGQIEIAHDPVSTMQWTFPRMSLSIEPGLLNDIQTGDKVVFTLVEGNGQYAIQDIRRQ